MQLPIRYLKGVGPKKEKLFHKLGIFFLKDLFYFFPRAYQDRTKISSISSLKEGESFLIKAEVVALNLRRSFFKKKFILEALLRDESGIIYSVWFNQPYLKNYLKLGKEFFFYGRVYNYRGRFQLVSPEFEEITGREDSLGIMPLYRLTNGFTQKSIRRIIYTSLERYINQLVEPLPYSIRRYYNFPNIVEALRNIHFPSSFEELKRSRQRFIFEEFFIMELLVYRRKAKFRETKTPGIKIEEKIIEKVKSNFEFKLTPSQQNALDDILKDLSLNCRTSRLLQGDVGSGKTVVAAIASFCVAKASYQVAFMVPTEVLAFQHKKTLEKLARGLKIKIEVLTGGLSLKSKRDIYKRLVEGKIDIIIGTHALLEERLKFKKLKLVIIDEQHRFGVIQRTLLAQKNISSDILVISATPIPRSLALSLYGDLDLSVIRELPAGRKIAQTRIVFEEEREEIYKFLESQLKEGRQGYIIYALVETEEEREFPGAVEKYEELKERFSNYSVGLLHGRLSSEQKLQVLDRFSRGKLHLLVSTLVVEVGMDVRNATVMIVENPERFGLSQLHQLRGRICRSEHIPYFFMVIRRDISPSILRRLEIIKDTQDGFKIAKKDLQLRGPGDLFGTLQAGYLPQKIASVDKDLEILKQARVCAFRTIKKDPDLKLKEHSQLREFIKDLLDKASFWQAG